MDSNKSLIFLITPSIFLISIQKYLITFNREQKIRMDSNKSYIFSNISLIFSKNNTKLSNISQAESSNEDKFLKCPPFFLIKP